MKKTLFIIAATIASFAASSQITPVASSKTIAMYDNKNTWLNMIIGAEGDTTYSIRIRSTYAYSNAAEVLTGAREKSHVLVNLGNRESAIAILQSMVSFQGANNTLVSLNNPSDNSAVYTNSMLGLGFVISDRTGVDKEFVKISTLEKILADIQNIKSDMEFEDQQVKKQEQATTGLIVAVVVGIGIAVYFIVKTMSL